MNNWPDQLYRLLPAIHQVRDGQRGEPLRQFLAIIGEQVQLVDDDIQRLYDNWFIETCEDWLVPYIGDLVGCRRVDDGSQPVDAIMARSGSLGHFLFPRREIGNLVRRRRRKGTLLVLEEMARDVTGWAARAVEFSRHVAFFQNAQHPLPTFGRTFCVRDQAATVRSDTPFDRVAHTIDVRETQPQPGTGWFHPYRVGLFVWRRGVYSATDVRPCRICTVCRKKHVQAYTFHRLGLRLPLYVNPQPITDGAAAQERNLPIPLSRYLLADEHGTASTDFYGLSGAQPKSLAIWVRWNSASEWTLVPNNRVYVCDLRDERRWDKIAKKLPCHHVAVDPESGLFLMRHEEPHCDVCVSYHYSFGADLGGGEYDRPASLEGDLPTLRLKLTECPPDSSPNLFSEIEKTAKALDPRATPGDPGWFPFKELDGSDPTTTDPFSSVWCVMDNCRVEITGSDAFEIDANQTLLVNDGKTLEIRAASGSCPLVRLQSTDGHLCGNPWRVRLGKGSRLVIDGLQLYGATMLLEEPASGETTDNARQLPQPCNVSATAGAAPASPAANCDPPPDDAPSELIVRHTTFVPGGRPVARVCDCRPNHASIACRLANARVCIQHSIVGSMNIEHPGCCAPCDPARVACPLEPIQLKIADSIVDAATGRPAIHADCCAPAHADLTVVRSTILGDVCVQQISQAGDSLFTGAVHVERRSYGYMRFCYVQPKPPVALPANDDCLPASPEDFYSRFRTPVRFKCLPEGGAGTTQPCPVAPDSSPLPAPSEAATIKPTFVSIRYGDPGYCQLGVDCPIEINGGAEDQSQLGVFHDLYEPQRAAALTARLHEFTPADLQSAVIYADDLNPTDFGCRTRHCPRPQ